jgi:hypothetical protein
MPSRANRMNFELCKMAIAPKQNDRRVSHPSVVCKKEEKDEELLGWKSNMQCMCQSSKLEALFYKFCNINLFLECFHALAVWNAEMDLSF